MGAAWAVPVIAIGASAPAFAASGGEIIDFVPGMDCKDPGLGQSNDTYHFQLKVTNTTASSLIVAFLSATYCNDGTEVLDNLTPSVYAAAPGVTYLDITGDGSNSARTCFNLNYSVDGGDVMTATFLGDLQSIKVCCTSSPYCPCSSSQVKKGQVCTPTEYQA